MKTPRPPTAAAYLPAITSASSSSHGRLHPFAGHVEQFFAKLRLRQRLAASRCGQSDSGIANDCKVRLEFLSDESSNAAAPPFDVALLDGDLSVAAESLERTSPARRRRRRAENAPNRLPRADVAERLIAVVCAFRAASRCSPAALSRPSPRRR